MSRIFRLYFIRSLPGVGAGFGALLLALMLLPPLKAVAERSTILYFALIVLLPGLAVLLGSLNGAEAAAEYRSEAEGALPVSAFSRLLGAALGSLAAVALCGLGLVILLTVLKEDAGLGNIQASLGIGAYLLVLLQACAYAFVFGRLSRSLMAGAAAGGILALLTTMGIMAATIVDAMVIGDARAVPMKVLMFTAASLCALLSLKYIAAVSDRKERISARNAGAAALLLSAGLLCAALLMAVSKSNAHKMLSRADAGDMAFLNFIYARETHARSYNLYENPVKGEFAMAGPDGSLRVLLPGKEKDLIEFFRDPMKYRSEAALTGDDGSAWLLKRDDGYTLYHAAPGKALTMTENLGIKGRPLLGMFSVSGRNYLAMAETYGDSMHYIAELIPGKPLKWEFAGQTKQAALGAVIKIKKASGRYAWLSKDRMNLLTMSAGKETVACRLPHKGAAFFYAPLYEAVRAGGRDLFFVPLMKDGKTALHYCERGGKAAPAWGGPEGFLFEFRVNPDGSAYTSTTRRVDGEAVDMVFYVINEAGEMLPPVYADRLFGGRQFPPAAPVKAAGKEVFFLQGAREIIKTDGKNVSEVARLDHRRVNTAVARDGVIFRDRHGLHLAGWDGSKRRLN